MTGLCCKHICCCEVVQNETTNCNDRNKKINRKCQVIFESVTGELISQTASGCNCTRPPPCLTLNGESITFPENPSDNETEPVNNTEPVISVIISCPIVESSLSTYHSVCINGSCTNNTIAKNTDETPTCFAKGINGNVELFTCSASDREPPVIQRPSNITRYTSAAHPIPNQISEMQTTLSLIFTVPNATDNSGYTEPVTCTPAGGSQFPIGQTKVTCSTADASGNNASCSFFVDVKVVDFTCPSDVSVIIDNGFPDAVITWEHPLIPDALGMNSSHQPGQLFPIGRTPVQYTLFHPTDPTDYIITTCQFHIIVSLAGTTDPEDGRTTRSTTTICNRSNGCNSKGRIIVDGNGSQCPYCSLLILPPGSILVLVVVRIWYKKGLKRGKNRKIGNGKTNGDSDKDPEAITKTTNGASKMTNGKQTSKTDETPKRTSNIHSNEAFEENEEVKNANSKEQKKYTAKDEKDTNKTQKTDNKTGSTANEDSSKKSVSNGVGLAKIGKLPSESNC